MSRARIISYNLYGETVCASAAKISTTKGNAMEIFEGSDNVEKNRALIGKVLNSGHKSIIEHAVFTIALENVSVFVEQFFIESRLASFTVKSRRYVDFSNLGYYIPNDLERSSLKAYCSYMDMLFGAYQFMLESGVPKEDARFLLPYSFHSNFYCTVNARELTRIINAMQSSYNQGIPELQSLAGQLLEQVGELFPSMLPEFDKSIHSINTSISTNVGSNPWGDVAFIDGNNGGIVELLQSPTHPMRLLETAYQFGHLDSSPQMPDLHTMLQSERLRELEQLSYTFIIRDISLSGITHIVRHRMQSIIVPPIQSIHSSRILVPATIQQNPKLLKQFQEVIIKAGRMREGFAKDCVLRNFPYYYILSGNLTNIVTTINARELMHFIRLRSCNRAQWEIRNVSIRMLMHLRESFPELFNLAGPSCYMSGNCPEGRLSCGKMREVIEMFEKKYIAP